MTDLDALYRAVLDHPDDDTPRLIYADALDDVAEADRAALVRAQVELARVPESDPAAVRTRTSTEYRDHLAAGVRWLFAQPELPRGLKWAREPFRRGFPAAVQADPGAAFADHADELFARFPIEELELNMVRTADVRPLAECEWLGRITRLTIRRGLSGPVARRLFESPHLGGLAELTVGAAMTTESAAREVVRSKAFGRLTAFTCHTDLQGGSVIAELTQRVNAPLLTRLDVSSMRMTAEQLARLTTAPILSAVEELDLSDNNLGPEGAAELAAARLSRLHTLRMLQTRPRNAGVAALARSGLMAGLRSLHLGRNRLGPAAAVALSEAAGAGHLRVLDLTDNRVGDTGAAALANSPQSRTLILLDLAENLIEDRGADALAESPHLEGLLYLGLSGNLITPPAARRLRERFGNRVVV